MTLWEELVALWRGDIDELEDDILMRKLGKHYKYVKQMQAITEMQGMQARMLYNFDDVE